MCPPRHAKALYLYVVRIGIDLGGGRGKSHILPDAHGRKFSAFWKVDPGREVRHTRVTTMLNLAYDTTVHAASAHLHPFAETLDLHDITANKTVVPIRADQRPDAIGLETARSEESRVGKECRSRWSPDH